MKVKPSKFNGVCSSYVYRGTQYMYKPKGTHVAYYIPEANGKFSGVLRRDSYIHYILMIIVFIVLVYVLNSIEHKNIMLVQCGGMKSSNGVLAMNLRNDSVSDTVQVAVFKDDRAITDFFILEPGADIGNVEQLGSVGYGTQQCQLVIRVLIAGELYSVQRKDIIIEVD